MREASEGTSSMHTLEATRDIRKVDVDAGWWLNLHSCWSTSVEVLVELYEIDREELLGFMKHVAFQGMHSQDVRASVVAFARRRSRNPPAPN